MTNTPLSGATARPYRNDDADWWRVRDLLVESHAGSPPSWNWDIRRWDGWRFHNEEPRIPDALAAGIGVWETGDGRLVAAVHPERGGDAHLELHPDHRHLQPEMLAWAEAHLARTDGDGRRTLDVAAWDYDLPLRLALEARRYRRLGEETWVRRLRFGAWRLPERPLPAGYRLRTTDPSEGDCERMAKLLNAGFGRTVHTAVEYRTFVTRSPSFRGDLNLVAEAPDGSFAAHVGLTYDETNRHGIFEPVCTHPAHRRLGLAQSLMFEGLHRLRALGAATAQVETGDMGPANALYVACGFTEEYRGDIWRWEEDPASPR